MCKDLSELADNDTTLVAVQKALEGQTTKLWNEERKVIGGNLSVLYGLQGTPWDLNHIIDNMDTAPILLLEDIAESHYHIDRMMNNLRLSGVLKRLSGVIIGYFTDCKDDERMGCSLKETIQQAVNEYNYPIIEAPVGHEQPNLPVLLG